MATVTNVTNAPLDDYLATVTARLGRRKPTHAVIDKQPLWMVVLAVDVSGPRLGFPPLPVSRWFAGCAR